MDKIVILILVVPLVLFMTILFSLVLGSAVRFMNEGANFKSPIDNNKPIGTMFKSKEFYKTLITGFFVFFTLLTIAKYLRGW
jgi:hypothetical protein